jgi:hypothetical protein
VVVRRSHSSRALARSVGTRSSSWNGAVTRTVAAGACPVAVRRNTAICRTVWPGRSARIEAECTSNVKVSPWTRQDWRSTCGRMVSVDVTCGTSHGERDGRQHSKGGSSRDWADLLNVFRSAIYAVCRTGTRQGEIRAVSRAPSATCGVCSGTEQQKSRMRHGRRPKSGVRSRFFGRRPGKSRSDPGRPVRPRPPRRRSRG